MQEGMLSKMSAQIIHFFSQVVAQADETAHFVKRKSKINARLFVETLVVGCLSDPDTSLERLCRLMKEKGVKVTKQGLAYRFNSEAVVLMKNMFIQSLECFKTEKKAVLDLLKPFAQVNIQDSSGIKLPGNLKEILKGCGPFSEAGLKIQVSFNYIDYQVTGLEVTPGCASDQGFNGHLQHIKKDELYLQDLGYFKLSCFEQLSQQGAYFVSRYLYPTALFNERQERIELLTELDNASSNQYIKTVFIGKREKIPVRLVAFRLSDSEVAKRIKKIKEKGRQRKKIPVEDTLKMARWSIYITNVPENLLQDDQVHLVYSLRWQIELFFKVCKSEAMIDHIHSRKVDRILCELYAKMIGIVNLLYMCFPIRWEGNQELSLQKAHRAWRLKATDFFRGLQSPYRLCRFLEGFIDDLKDFFLKDRYRKKRRLSYQMLMDSVAQVSLA